MSPLSLTCTKDFISNTNLETLIAILFLSQVEISDCKWLWFRDNSCLGLRILHKGLYIIFFFFECSKPVFPWTSWLVECIIHTHVHAENNYYLLNILNLMQNVYLIFLFIIFSIFFHRLIFSMIIGKT